MRPQDIAVLLQIVALGKTEWRNIDLSKYLILSPSEISLSLERSKNARLIDQNKKVVNTISLFEFLKYGIKYVFPANLGEIKRGISTAYTSPFFSNEISSTGNKIVWPYKLGNEKGESLEPLYHTLPQACENNPRLYELLTIVDTFRIGRARDVMISESKIKKIFQDYVSK